MNGYTRYPKKMKVTMMNLIFKKGYSKKDIIEKFNVNPDTLKDWIKRYKRYGENAFNPSVTARRKFDKSIKLSIVKDILSGNKSIKEASFELNCDKKIIKSWILLYNPTINDESSDDMRYLKIDANRKLEIVKFCVDNNYNYVLTAKEFNVSYANVYNWCRLFSKNGKNAFIKKPKKPKKKELSEETQRFIYDFVKKKLKEWDAISFGEIIAIGKRSK